MMNTLFEHLAQEVKTTYTLEKDIFDIPALPEAQCIVIPLVRETVAPMLIRNNDADMVTDMHAAGKLRVRMIASKTKGVERRRGSQILRSLGLGGRAAANKAYISKDESAGSIFDLNTFVFGDSANGEGKAIYPVHAAVLYSDALSVQDLEQPIIDDVFRQGGISEEYVSFDAQTHKTSSNIFTTRAVLPNTLFVQSLVMVGRRMTREAFDHLLLSIGLAGSYGGATATTGTNLKTYLCGAYWGAFERSINAPQEILQALQTLDNEQHVDMAQVLARVEQVFSHPETGYRHHIAAEPLRQYVTQLIEAFETEETTLLKGYQKAAEQMRELFHAWFTPTSRRARGRA
jgi:CRISPR-associated protein Csc2